MKKQQSASINKNIIRKFTNGFQLKNNVEGMTVKISDERWKELEVELTAAIKLDESVGGRKEGAKSNIEDNVWIDVDMALALIRGERRILYVSEMIDFETKFTKINDDTIKRYLRKEAEKFPKKYQPVTIKKTKTGFQRKATVAYSLRFINHITQSIWRDLPELLNIQIIEIREKLRMTKKQLQIALENYVGDPEELNRGLLDYVYDLQKKRNTEVDSLVEKYEMEVKNIKDIAFHWQHENQKRIEGIHDLRKEIESVSGDELSKEEVLDLINYYTSSDYLDSPFPF
ncbi:hypothetical protein [Weissella sp. MSCH1]|uniref:hypothetical protein n=1 Tax=Weissella sp. MSCH1 TaxID=3383343 RepID=UPI003896ABFC